MFSHLFKIHICNQSVSNKATSTLLLSYVDILWNH